jgi:phosphodiesterase/alkaline phosphatase D-like protein
MLQVWADATSALVVVMGGHGWKFSSHKDANFKVNLVKINALSGSDRVLYRLQVEGLSPTAYSQMAVYDQKSDLIDVRSLKALDLDQKSPKIAVISCANYRKLDLQGTMYSRLEEQRPDLNLFIGDLVYSNSRTSSFLGTPEDPGMALARYIETWKLLDLYRLEPLIPSISVWDDHDYGTNNGDGFHPYKNEMKAIFRAFYPLPESHDRLSYGPGVAFRLRAFGIDFP